MPIVELSCQGIRSEQFERLAVDDGEQTFEAIFEGIDRANEYVLAEFFIIKDDTLGRQFQERLINAAKRGCKVLLLYDDVGSQKLTKSFVSEL